MHAVSEHLLFSGTRRSNFAQEKTPTVAMIKPVWMVNGISETLTMKQRKWRMIKMPFVRRSRPRNGRHSLAIKAIFQKVCNGRLWSMSWEEEWKWVRVFFLTTSWISDWSYLALRSLLRGLYLYYIWCVGSENLTYSFFCKGGWPRWNCQSMFPFFVFNLGSMTYYKFIFPSAFKRIPISSSFLPPCRGNLPRSGLAEEGLGTIIQPTSYIPRLIDVNPTCRGVCHQLLSSQVTSSK